MDIDEDLIIGDNSKATLSSNDFLGSKAIILSIGDISKPLSDGDTISSEIDGGLSELLEKATPITCLLYTSPSPRDRQKSRMPSSA